MTYLELQDQLEAMTAPGHWMERGHMLAELSDDFIRAAMDVYLKVPEGAKKSALLIMPFGGAIADVSTEATSFGNRKCRYWCVILACFEASARDASIKWIEDVQRAVKPYAMGRYANTIEDELEAKLIYNSTVLTRLETLKAKWDPQNVFHHNHNIKPVVTVPTKAAN